MIELLTYIGLKLFVGYLSLIMGNFVTVLKL
nr:MAG TPA: hypothetical protein [Caudoviricetes sp.]DAV90656.1 MAG TPA: hypothetical protein [Caudoviricetes sp.]